MGVPSKKASFPHHLRFRISLFFLLFIFAAPVNSYPQPRKIDAWLKTERAENEDWFDQQRAEHQDFFDRHSTIFWIIGGVTLGIFVFIIVGGICCFCIPACYLAKTMSRRESVFVRHGHQPPANPPMSVIVGPSAIHSAQPTILDTEAYPKQSMTNMGQQGDHYDSVNQNNEYAKNTSDPPPYPVHLESQPVGLGLNGEHNAAGWSSTQSVHHK